MPSKPNSRHTVFLPDALHEELRALAYKRRSSIISELLKMVEDGRKHRAMVDADLASDFDTEQE